MSAGERTRKALITLQPVRRETSAQKDGPSSPWSWTIVRRSPRPTSTISSRWRVDEDADELERRFIAAPISRGHVGIDAPGALGAVVEADRPGAAETAASASSSLVMPQNFDLHRPKDDSQPRARRRSAWAGSALD